MKLVKNSEIPSDIVAGMVNTAINAACTRIALRREMSNSSIQQLMGISMIETSEVSAAKNTSVKKTVAAALAPK